MLSKLFTECWKLSPQGSAHECPCINNITSRNNSKTIKFCSSRSSLFWKKFLWKNMFYNITWHIYSGHYIYCNYISIVTMFLTLSDAAVLFVSWVQGYWQEGNHNMSRRTASYLHPFCSWSNFECGSATGFFWGNYNIWGMLQTHSLCKIYSHCSSLNVFFFF